MTAVQSRRATLADVQRYWLYMARSIREMDGLVPPGRVLPKAPSCMLAAPTREPCPNPGIGSPLRHKRACWLQTC